MSLLYSSRRAPQQLAIPTHYKHSIPRHESSIVKPTLNFPKRIDNPLFDSPLPIVEKDDRGRQWITNPLFVIEFYFRTNSFRSRNYGKYWKLRLQLRPYAPPNLRKSHSPSSRIRKLRERLNPQPPIQNARICIQN